MSDHKRRHDSDEEEDFIGFDDSDGMEVQESSFNSKRVRKVLWGQKDASSAVAHLFVCLYFR